MNHCRLRAIHLLIVILVFSSTSAFNQELNCNKSFDPFTWDSCNQTSFIREKFTLTRLNYDQLPYVVNGTGLSKPRSYNFDKDSIPRSLFNGTLYYHPVDMAQYGLSILDKYMKNNDTSYLNYVIRVVDKLLEISNESEKALFFPYSFNFALHGCKEETMNSPWYSSMAQGQILSLFCRLYECTHLKKYKTLSTQTFRSFTLLKGKHYSPWVSCIDKDHCLWLEEYPRELPCFTLNGMIFGIYGIYDYWRISNKRIAKIYLQASMTTIKANIHRFRNIDDISWYCLKHTKMSLARNSEYHKVHIDQLKMLYEFSHDPYYLEMAKNLELDTTKEHTE